MASWERDYYDLIEPKPAPPAAGAGNWSAWKKPPVAQGGAQPTSIGAAPSGYAWDVPDWWSLEDQQKVLDKYSDIELVGSGYLSPVEPEAPMATTALAPTYNYGGMSAALPSLQWDQPMPSGAMMYNGFGGSMGSMLQPHAPYAAVAGQGMGLTPRMTPSEEEQRLQRAVEAYLRMAGMAGMARQW